MENKGMTNTMYFTKKDYYGGNHLGLIAYSSRRNRYVVHDGDSHTGDYQRFDTLGKAKTYMEKNGWTYDPDIAGTSANTPRCIYRKSRVASNGIMIPIPLN